MKLVRITHYRCGDYDCVSFALAPADWAEDEVETRIDRAVTKYLEAVDAATAGVEKVAYPHPPQITAKGLDPSLTIGDALADFQARKTAYDEAEKARQYTGRSFEQFLSDEGFVSLWSDDARAITAEARWGHRHGQRLQYGNDHLLEQWPSPKKLHALVTGEAASDYDDDDFA